mmetsp:Transcript_89050/g.212605  ORF Transcript_89050/g.212605 Transcript_89050/m.212605 type:complete len:217 (+) Transcript_89050:378-1028(+)
MHRPFCLSDHHTSRRQQPGRAVSGPSGGEGQKAVGGGGHQRRGGDGLNVVRALGGRRGAARRRQRQAAGPRSVHLAGRRRLRGGVEGWPASRKGNVHGCGRPCLRRGVPERPAAREGNVHVCERRGLRRGAPGWQTAREGNVHVRGRHRAGRLLRPGRGQGPRSAAQRQTHPGLALHGRQFRARGLRGRGSEGGDGVRASTPALRRSQRRTPEKKT